MRRVLPAALFAFGGAAYREILMDCSDLKGDAAAGVPTLPARLGRGAALACALAAAGGGAAAALAAAAAAAAAPAGPSALVAPGVVAAAAFARLAQLAWRVWRADFDQGVLDVAVSECRKPVGAAVILLAAVASGGGGA